jgi:GrpB-like predicted nucleotidyltransferase (UPF0157 family)
MAVEILPHDPLWASAFRNEAALIFSLLPNGIVSIEHIGSTAIPEIHAKPVIDILCAVSSLEIVDRAASSLRAVGYIAKGEHGITGRRFFQKLNNAGQRTHHVHMFLQGSPHLRRHIGFRDFLLAHPDRALEYSQAKVAILKDGVSSRQVYQDKKAPLVAQLEAEALAWLANGKTQPMAG